MCVCALLLKDSKLLLKASSLQTELHGLATEFQKFLRVTSIGSGDPQKIPHTPAEPRRAPKSPRREPPQRPLRTPMRGKFPQGASRRVVPLRWCRSQLLSFSMTTGQSQNLACFCACPSSFSPSNPSSAWSESDKGGVENSEEREKHNIRPLPKTVLEPPTYNTFPPPFVHALSFPLEETGTDQINPTF